MRFTLRRSPSLTSVEVPSLRLRLCALEVSMWRRPECPRFTLPVAVFLKRLAAPLWVFNFGIIPRNQLPAACFQPSAWDIQRSIAVESWARLAPVPGEALHLRSRIGSFCFGGSGRWFFFFLRQFPLLLRFLLGFPFSFLLPLHRRFLRRQDGMQRVAFLPRAELHDALRFDVLDEPLQDAPA